MLHFTVFPNMDISNSTQVTRRVLDHGYPAWKFPTRPTLHIHLQITALCSASIEDEAGIKKS